ncbi:MAG: hypothetical protein J5545_12520 [Bacteroidaceae bacterium]|nr:hypothetical protein [Bacteroidaceae bacterium]
MRYQLRYFPIMLNVEKDGFLTFAGAKVQRFCHIPKEKALFFAFQEVFYRFSCRIQDFAVPLHPQTRGALLSPPEKSLSEAMVS